METIRNYLESMFKNLPQTEAVIKAKYELGQMMEDKYTELIREGKSENEAVGTVIAEFGNLEELAADLGIGDLYKSNKANNVNRRKLTMDEIKGFLDSCKKRGYFIGAGVACLISCVTGPIVVDAFDGKGSWGAALMFLLIAVGVSLCIVSKNFMEPWNFINGEACAIEPMCMDYLKNKKRDFTSTYSIMTSTGILLCVMCCVPAIIFGGEGTVMSELSGAFLFFFISAGVFLLIAAKKIKNSYERLLHLNEDTIFWNYDVNGSAGEGGAGGAGGAGGFAGASGAPGGSSFPSGKRTYKSTTAKTIMECFWPTMTCVYLTWSFLTFDWHITWLIWPIAGVLQIVLRNILTNVED